MRGFGDLENIQHLPIRCALSAAMALCLAIYLLINRSFDQTGLIIVVLGAAPWLILFFTRIEAVGFKIIKDQVEKNTTDIQTLALLMKSVLTKNELEWLFNFSYDKPVLTDTREGELYAGFKRGIEHMRGLGFVKNKKDHYGFAELENPPPGPRDARSVFCVTDEGRDFLKHLETVSETTIPELLTDGRRHQQN